MFYPIFSKNTKRKVPLAYKSLPMDLMYRANARQPCNYLYHPLEGGCGITPGIRKLRKLMFIYNFFKNSNQRSHPYIKLFRQIPRGSVVGLIPRRILFWSKRRLYYSRLYIVLTGEVGEFYMFLSVIAILHRVTYNLKRQEEEEEEEWCQARLAHFSHPSWKETLKYHVFRSILRFPLYLSFFQIQGRQGHIISEVSQSDFLPIPITETAMSANRVRRNRSVSMLTNAPHHTSWFRVSDVEISGQ